MSDSPTIIRNEGCGFVSFGWAQRVGLGFYQRNGYATEGEALASAERSRGELEAWEALQKRLSRIGRELITARGDRREALERERDMKTAEANELRVRIFGGRQWPTVA